MSNRRVSKLFLHLVDHSLSLWTHQHCQIWTLQSVFKISWWWCKKSLTEVESLEFLLLWLAASSRFYKLNWQNFWCWWASWGILWRKGHQTTMDCLRDVLLLELLSDVLVSNVVWNWDVKFFRERGSDSRLFWLRWINWVHVDWLRLDKLVRSVWTLRFSHYLWWGFLRISLVWLYTRRAPLDLFWFHTSNLLFLSQDLNIIFATCDVFFQIFSIVA